VFRVRFLSLFADNRCVALVLFNSFPLASELVRYSSSLSPIHFFFLENSVLSWLEPSLVGVLSHLVSHFLFSN
jgi:hypothetical protein